MKWHRITFVMCRSRRHISPNWAYWLALHCRRGILKTTLWFIVAHLSSMRKCTISFYTQTRQPGITRYKNRRCGSCRLLVNYKKKNYIFINQTQDSKILVLWEVLLQTWYCRALRTKMHQNTLSLGAEQRLKRFAFFKLGKSGVLSISTLKIILSH